MLLARRCSICADWLRRTHCKRGRKGTVEGRSAARPAAVAPQPKAKAKAKAAPKAQPLAPVVGCPGEIGVEIIGDGSCVQRAVAEIRNASGVMLMSYVYDAADIQAVLLQRPRGGSPFSLVVFIYKEQYANRSTVRQRPRLRDLRAKGAEILHALGRVAMVVFAERLCSSIIASRIWAALT